MNVSTIIRKGDFFKNRSLPLLANRHMTDLTAGIIYTKTKTKQKKSNM